MVCIKVVAIGKMDILCSTHLHATDYGKDEVPVSKHHIMKAYKVHGCILNRNARWN